MKITVEFSDDETRIVFRSQSDAEEHILGLIYTHKQIVEISRDYKEDGFVRSFNASPNILKLVLKEPEPQIVPEEEKDA